MKDRRGIRNITSALLNQLLVIAFGLILPKLFIMGYGSEMNGLLSSVNQVYIYVSLIGGGIGTASLQALYKTVAADDNRATNAIIRSWLRRAEVIFRIPLLSFIWFISY